MPTLNYDYTHVPTVRDFAKSEAFVRGLMGPFGSGKSVGCVIEMFRRSMAQEPGIDGKRKTRWAVIRNVYRQLEDTTIRTVKDWFPPDEWGRWRDKDLSFLITAADGVEIEILFRALDRPDQVSNLLSMELTGAWINEAREVPKAIIDAVQGRVGRFPARKDGGCTWAGVIMDTNPPDDDHWWYEMFEENRPDNMAIFKQPSGLSEKAENTENLPKDYYKNLAQGKKQQFIKVYIDGQYGSVSDGMAIYGEDWNDDLHVGEFELDPNSALLVGLDFGLTPAAIIGQQTQSGRLLVRHEIIATGVGTRRFVRSMLRPFLTEHYPGWRVVLIGDPAGNNRSESEEKTSYDVLREEGYMPISAASNDPHKRWDGIRWYLSTMIDGLPALMLHPECKMVRKGFNGGYRLRRLQVAGDERYETKADKNKYSHPHDGLQYLGLHAKSNTYEMTVSGDDEYSYEPDEEMVY